MTSSIVPETSWSEVSALIAGAMGLHFPRERWSDLQRGLAGAALEFGFDDPGACVAWLLSTSLTRAHLRVLANHLTIGETYFFRGKRTFEALTAHVLPALVAARRGRHQRLRLWSAGCCSGEEAYSLAILVRQVVPDWADWDIKILGTDINARFLQKAQAATYGEWSFRDAPEGLKESYFQRAADGHYVVVPEIRKSVTFAHLNLADDGYFSLAADVHAMDLIFCRNVLMYFTPAQLAKVVARLHHALADGGWLAVSPSEASQTVFAKFTTRNFPGAILYQKNGPLLADGAPGTFSACRDQPAHVPVAPYPASSAAVTPGSATPPAPREPRDAASCAQRARALANEGRHAEALDWCDRWLAVDKLDAAGHYLRAIVLLEQGAPAEARRSLQRAIYLAPDFVLAHYALGNLARTDGPADEADKHFSNALHLLARLAPDELLPESDGLTAGRLAEAIAALAALEGAP